ncbi:hypothetical protein QFC19_007503 [Naganishia cerealis]|uniref:Uncharacterized protein n=1 Tax=Naganishia cerealis TaxID=610337 RepID=A0ACC2VAD1_9TREE|nr:hypothetical protein QFC19_007503 [Naganishia cerealis]
MTTLDEIVGNSRALIQTAQTEEALAYLTPFLEQFAKDVTFLQVYGEALLENNNLETGFEVLSQACSLDPDALKGTEKFFYVGQIIGGSDGLQYLDVSLRRLEQQIEEVNNNNTTSIVNAADYGSKDDILAYLIKKMNQGIFAKIEIWMTDLCMEEEAETQCDQLINYSLSLDGENPEALSLLSSIRISQQRPEDAKQALVKSWDLFNVKKQKLEESANSKADKQEDATDVGLEYVELIQPLMTVARFAIELELYDLAITVASNIQDINEDALETYYYEALANLFSAKKVYATKQNINEDYRDVEVRDIIDFDDQDVKNHIAEAKSSLVQGYKIINSDGLDADPELVEQVNVLLNELGGASTADLMPRRDEEEEGWEDEIVLDLD